MAQQSSMHRYVYSGVNKLILYALIIFTSISLVNADQAESSDWLPQAADVIKKQEKLLKGATAENTKVDALSAPLKDIHPIKSRAQDCIDNTEAQLLKVTEDLATLGEPAEKAKEPPDVVKKRKGLTKQQKDLDAQLASCKLLLLQSQDLIKTINELQQSILAEQLSARSTHIITILAENIKAPVAGWQDSVEFLRAQYNLKLLSVQQFIFLLVLVIAGVVGGIRIGRSLTEPASLSTEPSDSVSAFVFAVRTSLAKSLPILLPVGIVAAYLSIVLPLSPTPFVTKASYAVGIYLCLIVWINILLSPSPPAEVYLTKPDELSRRLARQFKILATLVLIGYFLFTGEFKASLSEPVYYLSRSIFSVFLIINIIAALWLVRLFSWAILSRGPRITLSLVLLASLFAELTGYRNLSSFVLGGLLGTAISLALTAFIYRLLKDLCDGLDEGRLEWEENIRDRVGLKTGALVPGMIWIRLILFIGLWGGFAIITLHIWKLDDPWLAIITSYLTEGFEIGSLTVTPALLAGGILTFALIINLTRYIKNHILPHGLKHTSLDRGAREAVSSLVGYTGVAVAILIGLSITGVQMQNIAIIAGALSVGIGFGLQNIVNNFISGLILLFERPIRRGDWIVTGDTEGYVKAINIRSTQIQTFDRADVIVPNSELITAKVTNWMLRDPYGRVVIPIGVGYGSDVEQVHKILFDIASNHPMVITGNSQMPTPKVLFRNFGESSLDFELRFFIHDIDQRLNVISEVNFAIVEAFRREGIEIPFPQRVLTVANWQDKDKGETEE